MKKHLKLNMRIFVSCLLLVIFTILLSFLIYQITHKNSADKVSSFYIRLDLENLETTSFDKTDTTETNSSENSDTTSASTIETTISIETDTSPVQNIPVSSSWEAQTSENRTESAPVEAQTTTSDASQNPETTTISTDTPNPVPSNSPRAILERMSLEEKVGQMFIARCPEAYAAQLAADYHLGGYILFARDFQNKTKERVIQDINSYQEASSVPMLIGVDEEGGVVNRISKYPQFRSQPFQSPQELFFAGGFELIQNDTIEKCRLLHELGININFAPVCDVSENPNDFIYRRTFGKNAEETSKYIKTVVQCMKQQQMGCVLKHFPGYGNNADTHTGIAYDNRPYDTFLSSDFLPFQAGINTGADIVMVSHNIVNCMDSQAPASLSLRVHEILRNDLGFSGVIVTDELSMNGVLDYADDISIAIMAIQAGNDLLCCTNFDTQIPAVINAVHQGIISEARINESVLRILQMKQSLGIL